MTLPANVQAERLINKVPEATLFFWIIKMMSTTVGETGADYLNADLHFGLLGTAAVVGVLLSIALAVQMNAKLHSPPKYWLAVVLISVFGTLITDFLTDVAGVHLAVSTAFFGMALLLTFVVWYAEEGTLSVKAIDSFRRERYYWLAILLTFALGTAAGDWAAEVKNLGYGPSALVFGGLIALTACARYWLKANATACFWIAYVLTRPFGASCGDYLSQPAGNGGLGLGAFGTSALFLAVILGLVAYLSMAEKHLDRRSSN